MVKARSIGTGIGAFFNNPGVIILGGLAVLLLFFRGDIRNAFAAIPGAVGGGLGGINIQLPEINLPDITFPSFDFGGLFGGGGGQFPNLPPGGEAGIPLMPGGINPPEAPTAPTPIDVALSEGATARDIAAMIGIQPDDPNQDPNRFLPPAPLEGDPAFIGPIEPFRLADIPSIPNRDPTAQLNIGQFQGEATEAPLGALSLSRIIELFDVSASRAADIRFISQQGGDPFAEPGNIFGENPPAVSDPQFQGLTPEEIALQLTGGNISNF